MLVRDGFKIDFQEAGDGPVVLFIPGSYSTPMAWNGLQKKMPQRYRFVSTSLCGYGGTAETRSIDDTAMEHQVRVIEAVAQKIDAPVHLVGHSFGGIVALASALGGTMDILSLSTFEANPVTVVRERGRPDLYEMTRGMSAAFEAAYRSGDPDAAGRIIDFWGGENSFAAMPDAVQEYCRTTVFSNVLDWHSAYGFAATLADLGQLTMPALVVRGALANPVMVEITEALKASLPNNRSAVVAGAGHFLNTSHSADCARLLADFLDDVA